MFIEPKTGCKGVRHIYQGVRPSWKRCKDYLKRCKALHPLTPILTPSFR